MYQGKFSKAGPPPDPQPSAPKKEKRHSTLGGTIFYTLYFLFIILFCAGTLYGLSWLNGWLRDFEAAQPTAKAAAVFNQLFGGSRWRDLYRTAGIQDTTYENADSYAAYMENLVGGQGLSYNVSSTDTPGKLTYHVQLGDETIGAFTLDDRNHEDSILAIPDWQLGDVELYFDRDQNYRIVMQDGHTAKVNGVPLSERDTLQIATTVAEEYLPSGVEVPRICVQAVEGFFSVPQVEIFNTEGTPAEVVYDPETHTFTEGFLASPIPEDLKEAAVEASQYQALWLADEANSETTLKTHFREGTSTYKSLIRSAPDQVPQDSCLEFTDASVSGYARYNENHFSVRVEMDLTVTRSNGTVDTLPYSKSMIFQKQSSGKWLCIFSGNLDLNEPVGRVRLTFMQDDTPVSSDFYHTDAQQVITPVISAPEGKVFAGWVRHITDDAGSEALEVVFPPSSDGRVPVPEGRDLTPMTLYAHYETFGGD